MGNTFTVNGKSYYGTEENARTMYDNRCQMKLGLPNYETFVDDNFERAPTVTTLKDSFTPAERKFLDYQNGTSGSFYKSLVHTILAADDGHQNLLSKAYPELVEVVRRYQTEAGYWQKLEVRWEKFINGK